MTKKNLHITSWVRIHDGTVNLNGQILLQNQEAESSGFFREAYSLSGASYPKFFKMDNLCKLGWIAAELLEKDKGSMGKYAPERRAIVLQNSSSSLDTDLKHAQSIENSENYFPSPAVFVYTLPNIVAGEICIRQSIKGYTAFFIFEAFDPDFLHEQVSTQFLNGETDVCICGITELLGNQYDACLFMVEKSVGGNPFTTENMKTIYSTT